VNVLQKRPVTGGSILHRPNRDWSGIVDISYDDWDNNFGQQFYVLPVSA